jgi:hypothetical protein
LTKIKTVFKHRSSIYTAKDKQQRLLDGEPIQRQGHDRECASERHRPRGQAPEECAKAARRVDLGNGATWRRVGGLLIRGHD